MGAELVHLHVHTQFSFLDGAVRVRDGRTKNPAERADLPTRCKELGMRAVAVTDHGNMFGALQHYLACKDLGIQPILGCEINVAREGDTRSGVAPVDHLVLLARSERGYKNLVEIVSAGQVSPASEAGPSVAWSKIANHAEGLVALTGCLGGVVAQRILEQGEEAGLGLLDRMRETFEKGHLFLELQDHGFVEQPVVNRLLAEAAKKLDLPLVATNDVHYLRREDAEAQVYLSCVQTGRTFADTKVSHHGSEEMYLKSPEEMARLFRDYPGALSNTLAIAEMCDGWKLTLGKPMLPDFQVPEGFDTPGYFAHAAREGLERRFADFRTLGKQVPEAMYRERLETEIRVIQGMGFSGYFLIVWDFIRYAKEHGIPVGPGRGSGAGSLVAYAMRITDIDPLPYNLLFERFLNPERVSMPDFDIDFCMDRRDEVIDYVAGKYGRESVGQIATFHELKARSVIKDVARAMGISAPESQQIANLVPQKGPGQMCTIPEALEQEPKLSARVKDEPQIAQLIETAKKLESLTRHAGKHAAGVVISKGPLWDHVPCFTSDGAIVTQYDKDDVEKAGLVKFDFLGLKTLTVIDIAQRLVNERPDRQNGPKLDLSAIPLDDRATYQLLQTGETTGVFQLESSGMQQLFKDMRPDAFEDIVAAVALYRPGPLGTGMVKNFVDCKHGRQPITKMHPLVDDVLEPTYGVIVYQEQVMQIAQKLAGYTLGGADLLRRAMGKKKPEEMAEQRAIFVEGALSKDVSQADADRIFDLLEFFAGYGFNKSHSAAYGLLTYQTAYLKAHYPVEFLCALMTADRTKIDKVVRIIAEGRAWGATILPPDINASRTDFTVTYASPEGDYVPQRGSKVRDKYQPQIRFGLGAVRGIGDSVLEAIFEARDSGGPFEDLFDFASRVDSRKVNKMALESLVQCGAFDSTLLPRGIGRSRAHAALDRALERSREASKDRERGQTSLFGLMAAEAETTSQVTLEAYPQSPAWDLRETLAREKKSLGFYVSGHPLSRYGKQLHRFDLVPTSELSGLKPWEAVRVAGVVEGYRERIFKGGGRIAFFELEDEMGRVEVKVNEKRAAEVGPLLQSGEPVLIEGKVSFPRGADDEPEETEKKATIFLDNARPLADVLAAEARALTIRLHASRTKVDQFPELSEVLRVSPGDCVVNLVIELPDGAEAVLGLSNHRVAPTEAVMAGLERLFGESVAELGR